MNFQLGQTDTPSDASITGSAVSYFKPMIPWILLSGIISWYVGWKMGGVYCSARLLKRRIGSGIGSLGSKITSGIRAGKSKVGLKRERK